MNRKIEFRGIHIASKTMVYGCLIIGEIEGRKFAQIEQPIFNDFKQWEVDPNTIGQRTDFSDKNGIPIYEGDKDASGNVVEFLNGSWCVNRDRMLSSMAKSFEVAGNIHQNPELL